MDHLIKTLKDNNIAVFLHNDDLRVTFNGSGLPADLLKMIRENKSSLIDHLRRKEENPQYPAITRAPEGRHYPLSSSQYRLWVLSQFESINVAYNMYGAYVFDAGLDQTSLMRAFHMLLERHEILRTVFREDEEAGVRQFVYPLKDVRLNITCHDVDNEQQVDALLKEQMNKPFDLACCPLLRITLCRLNNSSKLVLIYIIHHIVGDGWSLNVLGRELLALYHACRDSLPDPLPPLPLQYKDYAVWQQEQLYRGAFDHHKAYWLKQFEGPLPVLNLPAKKERPLVKTYNGKSISRRIAAEWSTGIRSVVQKKRCSLFMGLLTAVYVLLHKCTGERDVIIGCPIAGREHVELEDQVGLYANTLALRARFNEDQTFNELLEKVRKLTLDAYEHQLYPFDELVKALNIQRNISRNVLFDVWVVLHNTDVTTGKREIGGQNLQVAAYDESVYASSKFDLLFAFYEKGIHIDMAVEFNTDILSHEEVEDMMLQFESILSYVSSNPDASLSVIVRHLEKIKADMQNEHLTKIRTRNLINLKRKI